MKDSEIIDIAKKRLDYSVMYGFIGEPSEQAILDLLE